ncbi:hypothetical protein AZF37_02605 [endosymbiont 'TC1' of Trimyema compressum]|uniref:ATP synthase F1 subunit epsilon n=1 Tax=endosymbiont 'TC1' of Trimyema compressum TaxID=243899 RepID=UPI0007F0AC33|nr:ATP synthase F1 subunit epsilon [endosymbiont 'TC1' of Trimyema compressum]AMP20212.1 hypothetical protein AZF37_02605 [endosymbiont 'TC1' of Trimyema compressum]
MDGLTLEVLSFDGQILKEDSVEMVNIDTTMGPINILKDHAPLMTALDIGVLSYIKKGKEEAFIALGMNGFAEVFDDHVSVIVNTAEKQEDIDLVRARRAKERSEAALKSGAGLEADLKAEIALKRAVTRISCKEGRCR